MLTRMKCGVACVGSVALVGMIWVNVMVHQQQRPPAGGTMRRRRPPPSSKDGELLVGTEAQFAEILKTPAAVQKVEEEPAAYECFARVATPSNATLWTMVGEKRVVVFVHAPKCGGSALTSVLRRLACEANRGVEAARDCCVNPGFCQRSKAKRRTCQAVAGCHGHHPQLRSYAAKPGFASVRAVTMLRDPLSRVVSAWLYRCHNPNFDCFDVPGAAKWGLQLRKARGAASLSGAALPEANVTFSQYLEVWPQYHNIQTRMLGRDAFPYSDVSVGGADLRAAIRVLDDKFEAVAVFELFEHSVALLARLAGVPVAPVDFRTVRSAHSQSYLDFRRRVYATPDLVRRIRAANRLDQILHEYATARLCRDLRKAGLLLLLLRRNDDNNRSACDDLPAGVHLARLEAARCAPISKYRGETPSNY